jgi:hypothetical protein
LTFEGVVNYVGNMEAISGQGCHGTARGRELLVQYHVLPGVQRIELKREALWFRIGGKNIGVLRRWKHGTEIT